MNCPCQSGQAFDQCCGRFISHQELPENAEQLMRSRYSAFHQNHTSYLLETWHPQYRPAELNSDSQICWLGLEIIEFVTSGDESTVEFEASFLAAGKVQSMREHSSFLRENGRWFYTRGEEKSPQQQPYKPSRNQDCPCGSGLKFKRCCANR